tara:strand:- start:52 stop:810 length:759 start_codon:yes stop_codon:yes gene_type:complete
MILNYKILGSGKPIIIMHGLMGMLDNWQAPARLLEDDFQCILVDMRNHGHSPKSMEHNYSIMVDDVIHLMDHLNLNEAIILGHSMGGKVAIKLAQEHPNRVSKLIVADIGPKFYPVHHQDVLAALREVPVEKLDLRTEAESYMLKHLSEPNVRQFLMKSLYRAERGSFAWRFNLDAIEQNIEQVGKALEELDFEGETLFIRGGNSNYILDEDWPDIKLLFPNAYLATIDGAGHWLHAEKPNEFVDAVKDFLS